MICSEVQRLIMPFINGKLDIQQLEEFIHHINTCSDCMEELEVYYVLVSGMRQLDEEKELSNNFHKDLINLLRESEDKILHHKLLHIRKRVGLAIMIVLAALTSSFRIGELVVDDVLNKEEKKSNYDLNNVFILHNPYFVEDDTTQILISKLPIQISKNLNNIYLYLEEVDKESADNMINIFGDKIWEDGEEPSVYGIRSNNINKKDYLY